MKVEGLEVLRCDAGWRNYHFLKLTTDQGIAGWSEFDEGFGSPGVSAVIERLADRVIGQPVSEHERVYAELYCLTRPAAGGVVGEGLGAIENALLDAKAKALRVPCYACSAAKYATASAFTGRIAQPGASITPLFTSRRSPASMASKQ